MPPHLREAAEPASSDSLPVEDIAEILLSAQRLVQPYGGIDLLFSLGIEKGRWDAVVWLVKRMVERFCKSQPQARRLCNISSFSQREESLNEMTRSAIDIDGLGGKENELYGSSSSPQSLHDLTNDLKPENMSRHERLQHDALGQVWRSLGRMAIGCCDGEIKPEILEIIAYLHHMGIMPTSIYNQKPAPDSISIQQPPTLHLFSSRILTSLSDAAWRAHERMIMEKAKTKGGEYASLRPEIPGRAYRIRVAGLRPEIWLELILWSCLHGGWILEGSNILRTIYSDDSPTPWRAYSWRSSVRDSEGEVPDWDTLAFMFNTRTVKASESSPGVSVHKTVSSEVVNAYVDALLSASRLGVGERGMSPGYAIDQLKMLQKFLDRSGLSLGAGSWDTVLMRFFDTHEHFVDHENNFKRLVDISPAIGGELNSNSGPKLPAYIFDGSAATLGLFHRAIRSRVTERDARGALQLFRWFQYRADENKRRSIVDFLEKQSRLPGDASVEEIDLFTSNFPGIDYPAFNVQLSPTVLAPFLELIADVQAYDFAKWLLYGDKIDGPVVSESMYADPILAPALFRVAAETDDKTLLQRLLATRATPAKHGHPNLERSVLQAMFDTQVKRCHWPAATRILKHIKETKASHWNIVNLAHVTRVMLIKSGAAWTGNQDAKENFKQAHTLFSDILQGTYERKDSRPDHKQDQINNLLVVLSTVDKAWAGLCGNYIPDDKYFTFNLPTNAFNLVLEGIVHSHGSVAGQQTLATFWSHGVQSMQQSEVRSIGDDIGEPLMPRWLNERDATNAFRNVIRTAARPEREIVMYWGVQPDLMTIRIILRRALEELKVTESGQSKNSSIKSTADLSWASDWGDFDEDMDSVRGEVGVSASAIAVWAARQLRLLRIAEEDIMEELQTVFSEHGTNDMQTQLPQLVE